MSFQQIELEVLKVINVNRDQDFDGFFQTITDSAFYVAFGVPLLLIIVNKFWKNVSLGKKPYYLFSVVISSAIVSNILKYTINRPRPFITHPIIEKISAGGSPSFPSGHTTDAFAIATAISIAYPKWYIIIPAYAWAFTVAYSRMFLGVHYLSDVIAGILFGVGIAFLCKALLKKKFLMPSDDLAN